MVRNQAYEWRAPIRPAEVRQKRATVRKGDILDCYILQLDEAGMQEGIRREKCQVEVKSRYLVVLRRLARPRAPVISRTYVELCMQDRGARII